MTSLDICELGKTFARKLLCDSASVFAHVFVRGKTSNSVSNVTVEMARKRTSRLHDKWHSYTFRIALAQHSTGVEIYCFS